MAYEDYPTQTGQSGARLSYGQRQRMPSSSFALPGKGTGPKGKGGGSYPIPDISHGRNALARVAQHGSSEEKARVRAAVHRKFPGIKQAGARGWEAEDYPGRDKMHHEEGRGVGARRPPRLPHDDATTHYYAATGIPSGGGGASAGSPGAAGARTHGDEAQDRALIKRMLAEHDRHEDGTQYGARMAPLGRDHSLAIASATHLHRMGHINKQQLKAIHAHARNSLAANRGAPPMGALAPGPVAGPAPPMGGMGGGMGGGGMGGGMGAPSFGSIAPPEM